jgi:hypothetical protein
MVEVLMAVLLLGLVSAAIASFLMAVGARAGPNQRLSDPALEAIVAVRRLGAIAPGIRCVLATESDRALVWLSDDIPNFAVEAREIGLVRFDAENGELLLEMIAPDALRDDPTLDAEYEQGSYGGVFADFDELRSEGVLVQRVLAEGVQTVRFEAPRDAPNTAQARFRSNEYETLAVIAPIPLEVPLR